MNREEALKKIDELKKYIEDLDKENIGFENDKIFLLSIKEYDKYKANIPNMRTWWWLRSPGYNNGRAATVETDGSVFAYGNFVDCGNRAIRPALKYSTLKSKIVKSKIKNNAFIFNETRWIIIDKDKEIAISEMPIAFQRFSIKNNNYENSEIRKYLKEWIK